MKLAWAVAALVLSVAGVARAGSEAAPPANPAVDFIGEFSNEVYSNVEGDPHASGYTLVLYRQGERVFGTFYAIDGLAGDTPAGRIEAARLLPSSHQLSFSAKLTTGSVWAPQSPHERPARAWFAFKGRLSPGKVTGKLVHKDGYDLQNSALWKTENVTLKKRKRGYAGELPTSYQNWLDQPLLNGPEW
jgi:hypothetical protein